MIETAFFKKNKILDIVSDFMKETFEISQERVIDQLKPFVDMLVDDIIVFFEFPYVDKFYRDTFYNFFSVKHNQCERDSIRLSFFDNSIKEELFFNEKYKDNINEHFFGYITLRPTTYSSIGHSFLSPKILKNKKFVTCLSKENVLVNGFKLEIHGFPYISQDNESITCSESVLINIMDYFGHKYPEYSYILPSKIHKVLSKHSFERQLPSKGLPTESISFVLKKLGFGTVVYSNAENIYEDDEFKELLYTYIESGIPVILTLSSEKSHHAVIAIGREDIDKEITYSSETTKYSNYHYHPFSTIFDNLLVMNDNHRPYELVNYDKPLKDEENSTDYVVKSFIVPLYPKAHLEAYKAKRFFFELIETFSKSPSTKHIKFINKSDCILRMFLTSSKSYKNFIALSNELSYNFKSFVIRKSMPKFVWVCEVIKGKTINDKQNISSFAILDATESGLTDHLILASDLRYMILKNNDFYYEDEEDFSDDAVSNTYKILDFSTVSLLSFTNNLKGEHTQWRS